MLGIKVSDWSYSTQRLQLMTQFHHSLTTELPPVRTNLWPNFTKDDPSCPKFEPIAVQHCHSSPLNLLVKKHFPVNSQVQHNHQDSQVTKDEQCALRYVAGYVLRNVEGTITNSKLRVQHKEDMLWVLSQISTESPSDCEEESLLSYTG